jgi:hypothetical protein
MPMDLKRLLLLLPLLLISCAPNASILQDNRANTANAEAAPTPTPEPPKKLTVAELMDRVANASPDAYLFPCTLNAYSAETRAKLKKVRAAWLAKEQDGRYLISPSTGCVCPGICVLAVEDTQAPPPNNSALIIIGDLSNSTYRWFATGLDLSHSYLSWLSGTPKIDFSADGKLTEKSCMIRYHNDVQKYVSECSDANGKPLPPL